MRKRAADPRTLTEWQDAVNGASFFLLVDSARQYGLVTGGPKINADRCDEILRRGAQRAIRPLPFEELVKIYGPEVFAEASA